jgi:hypothetical protein
MTSRANLRQWSLNSCCSWLRAKSIAETPLSLD